VKVLIVYQDTERGWGQRIADFIADTAPGRWSVDERKMQPIYQPVLDEPQQYLPQGLPEADLLVVLAEDTGLSQLIPDLVENIRPEAVIVPVDSEEWLPVGLRNQVRKKVEKLEPTDEIVFPAPFCSLTEGSCGSRYAREFARCFGRPVYRLAACGERIRSAEIERSAPCGNARYIAERLQNCSCEEAPRRAGLYHQLYPCLAALEIIHDSAHISKAAVKRALSAEKVDDES